MKDFTLVTLALEDKQTDWGEKSENNQCCDDFIQFTVLKIQITLMVITSLLPLHDQSCLVNIEVQLQCWSELSVLKIQCWGQMAMLKFNIKVPKAVKMSLYYLLFQAA